MIDLSISQSGPSGPDFNLVASWDTEIAPKEIRAVFEQAFETIGEHVHVPNLLTSGPLKQDVNVHVPDPLAGAKARIRDLLNEDEQGKGEAVPGDLREAQELVQYLRRRLRQKDIDLAIRRQNIEDLDRQLRASEGRERAQNQSNAELLSRCEQLQDQRDAKDAELEKVQDEFTRFRNSRKTALKNLQKRNRDLQQDLDLMKSSVEGSVRVAALRISDNRGSSDGTLIYKSDAARIVREAFGMEKLIAGETQRDA